jgi:hypothetical protein
MRVRAPYRQRHGVRARFGERKEALVVAAVEDPVRVDSGAPELRGWVRSAGSRRLKDLTFSSPRVERLLPASTANWKSRPEAGIQQWQDQGNLLRVWR